MVGRLSTLVLLLLVLALSRVTLLVCPSSSVVVLVEMGLVEIVLMGVVPSPLMEATVVLITALIVASTIVSAIVVLVIWSLVSFIKVRLFMASASLVDILTAIIGVATAIAPTSLTCTTMIFVASLISTATSIVLIFLMTRAMILTFGVMVVVVPVPMVVIVVVVGSVDFKPVQLMFLVLEEKCLVTFFNCHLRKNFDNLNETKSVKSGVVLLRKTQGPSLPVGHLLSLAHLLVQKVLGDFGETRLV